MASSGSTSPPGVSRSADLCSLAVLALFMVLLTCLHQSWISQNLAPPREDDNMQLVKSLNFHRNVGSAGPRVLQQVMLGRAVDFYPPLTYGVTHLFYGPLGTSEQVGRFSLVPFMVLLGFSVYGIGRRLWGPLPGLAAAVCSLSAPVFSHYSHSYFLDGPLTAVVAFHLYCLLRADDFRDDQGTLLWGLSVGMGLMVKWTFVPWVLVPNLLALAACARRDWRRTLWPLVGAGLVVGGLVTWHQVRSGPPPGSAEEASVVAVYLVVFLALSVLLLATEGFSRGRLCAPLAWGLLVACTLALPWYVENLTALGDGTRIMGNLLHRDPLSEKVVKNLAVVSQMLPGAPLLLLLGITCGLLDRRLRSATTWLLVGGVSGFVLLSVLLVYSDRYIMPVLPFVCLLGVAWITRLARWALAPVLVGFPLCLWQVAGALPSLANPVLAVLPPAVAAWLPQTQVAPIRDDYHVMDVLRQAQATGPEGRAAIWIMNHRDSSLVQGRTYEYKALENQLPVEIMHVELEDVERDWAVRNLPRGTHLLVLWTRPASADEWVKTATTRAGWKVERLTTWHLPLGNEVSLFRRLPATAGPSGGVQGRVAGVASRAGPEDHP